MSRESLSKSDKRDMAVKELLSTEATYVSEMKVLVNVFVEPLETWADDMEAKEHMLSDGEKCSTCISRADCAVIFSNAKQLTSFNQQLLLDLRKAHDSPEESNPSTQEKGGTWPNQGTAGVVKNASKTIPNKGTRLDLDVARAAHDVGGGEIMVLPTQEHDGKGNAARGSTSPLEDVDAMEPADDREGNGPRRMLGVFLMAAPFFKMYSLYIKNFESARERLTALKESPEVSAFLSACERQKACHGLRLQDFLIQPVQVRLYHTSHISVVYSPLPLKNECTLCTCLLGNVKAE
ncbi:unnamed protein product [Choristocarpus tenellus]